MLENTNLCFLLSLLNINRPTKGNGNTTRMIYGRVVKEANLHYQVFFGYALSLYQLQPFFLDYNW